MCRGWTDGIPPPERLRRIDIGLSPITSLWGFQNAFRSEYDTQIELFRSENRIFRQETQ